MTECKKSYKLVDDVIEEVYTLYIDKSLYTKYVPEAVSIVIRSFFENICQIFPPDLQYIEDWYKSKFDEDCAFFGNNYEALKKAILNVNTYNNLKFYVHEANNVYDGYVITVIRENKHLKCVEM